MSALKSPPVSSPIVSCISQFTMKMSHPCHYSQHNKLRLTQIYRWLFFVYTIFPGSFLANRLESQDAVLVNFHRRYNVSKVVVHNGGYLPPVSTPDFSLPEVIDNRARNVATDETRPYSDVLYHPLERDSLRVFTRKGPQDARYSMSGEWQLATPRRPVFLYGKQKSAPHPSFLNEISASSFVSDISIEEMSCQNVGNELFFRASIKAPRTLAPPVIDNAMDKTCQVLMIRDSYHIKFENNQMWNCGVVDCSENGNQSYCLDLRFPVIAGLRLRDDHRVTLRCKTQDKIAHHTKRISVKTLEAKGRNAPSMLYGGFENALDVDIGLFRKSHGSENIFDARIHTGGTVVLGEEILLRVLVNGDDGWRYSKIGQVTVHHMEERQERKILNSLWILDKDGCLNSDVREICPREQYRASPLESYLIFQAFMFEGTKETDEISLTVKATACLEPADCILDCPVGHVRHARSVSDQNSTVEWQNDIILRVVPSGHELRGTQNYYLAIVLSLIVLLVLIASLWFINSLLHQKSNKILKSFRA